MKKKFKFKKNKNCVHCLKEFVPNSGHQTYCRICVPHQKAKARILNYRCSQTEYEELLRKQSNKCAICKVDLNFRTQHHVHLDHCHTNNHVRGVLCNRCNMFIGQVEKHNVSEYVNNINKYLNMCHSQQLYLFRDTIIKRKISIQIKPRKYTSKNFKQLCINCNFPFYSRESKHRYCITCGSDPKMKHVLNTYGINSMQYESIINSQNNSCGICYESFSFKKPADVHVDHCHETNKIRGILCYRCNVHLGFIPKHINYEHYLSSVVDYINRNSMIISDQQMKLPFMKDFVSNTHESEPITDKKPLIYDEWTR